MAHYDWERKRRRWLITHPHAPLHEEIEYLCTLFGSDFSSFWLTGPTITDENIPWILERLSRLDVRWLYLNDTKVTTLPPHLCMLTSLLSINVDRNDIHALPDDLTRLPHLRYFSASHNKLCTVPDSVCDLLHISHLDLSHNSISALPSDVAYNANLTTLLLAGNRLRALPDELGFLTTLEELDLCNNEIGWLPPSVGELETLEVLRLSGNQLQVLPPEIGSLYSLRLLDLADNRLRALPKEMRRLASLFSLILSRNALTHLFAGIDTLPKLEHLALDGNPWVDLPIEITRQLTPLLDAKAEQLLTSKGYVVNPHSRGRRSMASARDRRAPPPSNATCTVAGARVLLLGMQNNSHFAQVLSGRHKKGRRTRSTTWKASINVETLVVATRTHGDVRVRLFDCGGYPERYHMHSLWWHSLRSVMLLVLDTGKAWGWVGNRADYLLRSIESWYSSQEHLGKLGLGSPPVILVASNASRGTSDRSSGGQFQLSEIMAAASQFAIDVRVVSCVVDPITHEGVGTVLSQLGEALENTHGIASALPTGFVGIRQDIHALFGSFEGEPPPNAAIRSMSMSAFRNMCTRHFVCDLDEATVCLWHLHALGDVLLLAEASQPYRIVNPHWANVAFYRVLSDDLVRSQRGIITLQDWRRLFGIGAGRLLTEVMMTRGVLYEVPSDRVNTSTGARDISWLVPDLLEVFPERHDWVNNVPAFRKEYGRFLSEAVFLDFVGRNQADIRPLVGNAYRNQVMLTHPQNGAKALVVPDYLADEHSISIYCDPNCESLQCNEWAATLYARLTGELPSAHHTATSELGPADVPAQVSNGGNSLPENVISRLGAHGLELLRAMRLGPQKKSLWFANAGVDRGESGPGMRVLPDLVAWNLVSVQTLSDGQQEFSMGELGPKVLREWRKLPPEDRPAWPRRSR